MVPSKLNSLGVALSPTMQCPGQRRRTFDDTAFEAANAVDIKRGEPFTVTGDADMATPVALGTFRFQID